MTETMFQGFFFFVNDFVSKIVTLCKSKNNLYGIEWHLIFVTKKNS